MLSNFFGILQGLFARPFVVGLFCPALIAIALNGFAVALYTGLLTEFGDFLKSPFDIEPGVAAVMLVGSAILLGVCITPLLTGVETILSGRLIPRAIRRARIRANRTRAYDLSRQIDFVRFYQERLTTLCDQTGVRLQIAQEQGKLRQRARDRKLVFYAVRELLALRHLLLEALGQAGGTWSFAHWNRVLNTMAMTADRLEAALRANTVEFSSPEWIHPADHLVARDLAVATMTFFTLVHEAKAAARSALARLVQARAEMVAVESRPTRFGNLRAEMEAYTDRVYRVSFLYLWSRLQLIISDGPHYTTLHHARTQLDFILASMLLSTITILVWLAWFLWKGESLLFLATGIIAPFFLRFLYFTSLQCQRTWTQSVKAIMDGNRLQVLKMLAAPDPRTDEHEKTTWSTLQKRAAGLRSHHKERFFFRPTANEKPNA